MGPGAGQTLTHSRDSPPKTNGNGDLRQWKIAAQSWDKMRDKLLVSKLKGAPKDLRGLLLLGHLSGSARAIAGHMPQHALESDGGAQAIIDAIVVTDPASDTQRLYNSWEKLGNTIKFRKESFSKHMQRFRSNWADLEKQIDEKVPVAMEEQASFQLLRGSGLDGSDMAQVLSSAMRNTNNGIVTLRAGSSSADSDALSTRNSDISSLIADFKEKSRVLHNDLESASSQHDNMMIDMRALKDNSQSTLSSLPEDSAARPMLLFSIEKVNQTIFIGEITFSSLGSLRSKMQELSADSSALLTDFSSFMSVARSAGSRACISQSRKPLVAIDSMASALIALGAANFGVKKGGHDRGNIEKPFLGVLNKWSKTPSNEDGNKKTISTKSCGRSKRKKVDKSKSVCHECGEKGHWRGDRECKNYDPSKRKKRDNYEEPTTEITSDSDDSDDDDSKN